jgi:hypothetical protein
VQLGRRSVRVDKLSLLFRGEFAKLEEVVKILGLATGDELLGKSWYPPNPPVLHGMVALNLIPVLDFRKRHVEEHGS